ncbi:MAG: peptidase S41, partial [Gemmatimonadetes bacterium]|nr:peptidase S41 [Gemmatimonadota bacterium]
GNTGGNMWPMIAGVGPILGEDTVGFFVDPDSIFRSWSYVEGEARINDSPVNAAIPAYELEAPGPHVAVLTDSLTASSGEAVAVAFRGRDGARSFGQPTWGLSTANAPFLLDDGAVIFLTVSTMVDRAGVVYGGEVAPDEVVMGEKTGDPQTDEVLEAALTWLTAQSCV